MKMITVVLLAALACLIGLRIFNQSRRNHVDFVTFSSDAAPGPENPVDLPMEMVREMESVQPEDFQQTMEEIAEADTSEDAMAVLFDTRTKIGIISLAVMEQIACGNHAVSRKVKRFLQKAGAENVLVTHLSATVQEL